MATSTEPAEPEPAPPDAGGAGTDGVGARLRGRRRARRMTLREVATAAELSEGFLSQVERGVHAGSVATLQRVCRVLGLNVGDLFADDWGDEPSIHRFAANHGFAFGENGRKIRLTPAGSQYLEVFVGEFEPGGSTGHEPYSHGDSEELLLVLSGTVEVQVDDTSHRLGALDSITYSSNRLHRVAEAADATARVLWSIAPPSY